jgi:uncharacterized protein VirK/YbjX
MTPRPSNRMPGPWQAVAWAIQPGAEGGGTSRLRLVWRAIRAALWHGNDMRRWMAVVFELHSRGIVRELPAEYLRAVRPYVHRGTGFGARVVQLIDHADWMETAFQPAAFEQLASGQPLVLAELAAPRGYDFMGLQLQRSAAQSPEGEMLLTLNLRRAASVQHRAQPVDAAVLGFSRFRVDGVACLVIGGVRGQRHPVLRISPMELTQALQGWNPAVLLVRVAQELARYWNLHLIGLDPREHRLHGWSYQWTRRYREAGQRIFASYDALWQHFQATSGPTGWVILPANSDEKLSATALSPEKRQSQTRRADYWIRTRNLLRVQLKQSLQRPGRETRLSRATEGFDRDSTSGDDQDVSSEEMVPARVLQTGPGEIV